MRENTLKAAWRDGEPTLGIWLTGIDPLTARRIAHGGPEYVCIDMQHGTADYGAVLRMLMAMEGAPAVPIVRVPWNEPGIIGRVLDAGAMGVIVPMVNTVDQANAAVSSCFYPPGGSRSNGPVIAAQALGPDYAAEADDNIVCVPMIETAEAVANLDDIAAVPGIDAFYVGPADLSRSLGLPPTLEQNDPTFVEAIARIVEVARSAGIAPGIHSTPALSAERIDFGFQMVTVTSDVQAAEITVTAALSAVRQGRSGSGSATGY